MASHNFRGSHDEIQIKIQSLDSFGCANDQQIQASLATRTFITKDLDAARHQAPRILAMLRTPAGATIAAIMTATEWQQHSVRGFLAGVVRKKLGLNLVSESTDKGRVYRIKDGKASSGAADRVKQSA
jgi:hypothetical protein